MSPDLRDWTPQRHGRKISDAHARAEAGYGIRILFHSPCLQSAGPYDTRHAVVSTMCIHLGNLFLSSPDFLKSKKSILSCRYQFRWEGTKDRGWPIEILGEKFNF